MNVYQKLLKVRLDLQNINLKKSGQNKFAGYEYFELSDFLPTINKLFYDNGLCALVSFEKELAYMTIVDTEKPDDKIIFTSPMSTAQLKGCHEVQNLGAVETYQRRYLYMTALEIVEHDNLEPLTGQESNKSQEQKSKPKTDSSSFDRVSALTNLVNVAKQKGFNEAAICKKAGITEIKYIKNELIQAYTLEFNKLPDRVVQ